MRLFDFAFAVGMKLQQENKTFYCQLFDFLPRVILTRSKINTNMQLYLSCTILLGFIYDQV